MSKIKVDVDEAKTPATINPDRLSVLANFTSNSEEYTAKKEECKSIDQQIAELQEKRRRAQNEALEAKQKAIVNKIETLTDEEKKLLLSIIPCTCKKRYGETWNYDQDDKIAGCRCLHCGLKEVFDNPYMGIDFKFKVEFDFEVHDKLAAEWSKQYNGY